MTRYYSNIATPTTLAAGINNTDVTSTITVSDALTGWPASKPYTALIDKDTASEEMVLVTAVNGTTITATRGVHGYGKYSHTSGAAFTHAASSQDLTDHQAHIDSTSGPTTHVGLFPSLIGNTAGHAFHMKCGVWSGTLDSNAWAQITHGLGGTPTGVVASVVYAASMDCVVTLVDTYTSTTFGVRIRRVTDGSTAPHNSSATINWIAWRQA